MPPLDSYDPSCFHFLCEAPSGKHVLELLYPRHRLVARAVTPKWRDLGRCLLWDVLTFDNPGCDSYPPPKKGCIDWRPTSPVASGLPLCHICLGHDRIFGEREVHRDNMDRFAQRTGRASCFDPRRIELLDQYYGDVLLLRHAMVHASSFVLPMFCNLWREEICCNTHGCPFSRHGRGDHTHSCSRK